MFGDQTEPAIFWAGPVPETGPVRYLDAVEVTVGGDGEVY